MTRVLVTGANGHLGANIVRSLLKHGHEVIPFIRRSSDVRGLEGLDLSYRYGDMMDAGSLAAAAQGCEVIIHTAAVYRFWAKNPDDIIRPTLVGTRNLFTAAKQAGVKRIVYTSTTFAVGSSDSPDTLRTAEDWNTDQHLPYTIAKTRGEQQAWQLAGETGIALISLCPNGILGPYDYGMTPTTELLCGLINGSGQTFNSGTSFVDVRDVAEVHARAVDAGTPGQRYIIAGEQLPMRELGDIIARLTGVKPPHIGAGRSLSLVIAGLMEMRARVSGSQPALTRNMVRELIGRYHYYDCEKTWQAFGLTPRPSEEMLVDAIRWLLFIGQIKPALAEQLAGKYPADSQWSASDPQRAPHPHTTGAFSSDPKTKNDSSGRQSEASINIPAL